jgi:hypothetical protein
MKNLKGISLLGIVCCAGWFFDACGGSPTSGASPTSGSTVSPGTWSYVISALGVPLNSPVRSCAAPDSSGTTLVSNSGTFSIPFSGLACNNCAMSGVITGTIVPERVSGSVTASISGSGCSNQQPGSPAAMIGSCKSTGCSVALGSGQESFALNYTLTPP